ncbi:MAG: hypothetical protein ACKOOL_03095 [Novosphingobium sp.]
MTSKFYIAAGLFLIASGSPILAATSNGNGAEATAKSEDSDLDKVVCRRVESIGTRLGSKRVCRTKGEWDAQQAADRQNVERTQAQRYGRDNN